MKRKQSVDYIIKVLLSPINQKSRKYLKKEARF